MNPLPRIDIDTQVIRRNAQFLCNRLGRVGISVTGVTKGVGGHPAVAQAMLDGGVVGLADSRLDNVMRLRTAGITCPISLIRAPMRAEMAGVVAYCTNSYNTELETIALLGAAALAVGRVHGVMLMVEVGDSREGLLLRDLPAFVLAVHRHSGLRLDGVGVNFACLSGVPPTTAALLYLCAAIATAESASGIRIPQLSGGNSASLPLLLTGPDHARVNNLRLGESILLGCEPVSGRLINGLSDTAFGLVAEVIESSHKSHRVTVATTRPVDISNQVVLALGSQDTDIQGLGFPLGCTLAGSTSDHSVLDTGKRRRTVGSEVALTMNYSALSRAMAVTAISKRLCVKPQPAVGVARRPSVLLRA